MLEEETAAEVEEWVAGQEGVVDTGRTESAVHFRVRGGQWAAVWKRPATVEAPRSLPNGLVGEAKAQQEVVVGDQRKEHRWQKQALVLSPIDNEVAPFGVDPDSRVARDALEQTRGYQNGSVLELRDGQADLAAFKAFDVHDVIHLAAHGSCMDDQKCRLLTGEQVAPPYNLDANPWPQKLLNGDEMEQQYPLLHERWKEAHGYVQGISEPGVSWKHNKVCDPSGSCEQRFFVSVNSDFFKNTYPGGLDDTFVFASSCHAGRQSEDGGLGLALVGENSAYLSWTDSVSSGHTPSVVRDFYETATRTGLPVADVLDEMDPWGTGKPGLYNEWKDGKVAWEAWLLLTQSDQDVRLREVVTLLDPYDPLENSGEATALLAADSYTDDGREDALDLKVRIEGVQEGFEHNYSVRFEIDGEPFGGEYKVTPADKTSEYTYELEVEDVPTGKKLKREQTYDLTAVSTLSGQGTSVHHVENVRFQFWCDVFPFPAFTDDDGEFLAQLDGACAQYNAELEPNARYSMCVCGKRPLEEDGVVETCDILCSEAENSDRCGDFSGPGVVPEAWNRQSNCFKPEWEQAGFEER
jgi:hypothetical protein